MGQERNWANLNTKQKTFYIRREQENIKDRIIRDIWTLFETEEEKEERNESEKKKKENEGLIEDKIIRDIRILFEQEKEEEFYKPKRASSSWNNNYSEYESNGDKTAAYH